MVEYQFTVSISHHGHELENGEKLCHGFANSHLEAEAVVEQNTEIGVLSATFWYEAPEDFKKAIRCGAAILDAAMLT